VHRLIRFRPGIKTQVYTFLIVFLWDICGVAAARYYADQSLMALPASAVLTGFWLAGVKLAQDKRVWPVAILAAVLGTLVGILIP